MALKTFFAAGLLAATMAVMPGPAAEAKTKIVIGIGGYADPCWGYRGHRCGWHPRAHNYYYVPRHRPVYYYDGNGPGAHRLSCNRARNIVEHSGFNRVRARDCSGKYYSFKAVRKGHNYLVRVNAFSGRIVGSSRI